MQISHLKYNNENILAFYLHIFYIIILYKMNTQQEQQQEPTLVFIFDLKQWTTQISALTKLEFVDYIPNICTQFFVDKSIPAYVLTLTKTQWNTFTPETKLKFKTITRRLREEIEGAMTQVQRDAYESSDPFEVFAQKRKEEEEAQAAQALAQIQSQISTSNVNVPIVNEDIDISAIENSLSR